MARNIDFTLLSAMPAGMTATVDDPTRYTANGFLLKAGEVLSIIDGSVSASIASDITIVGKKVNADDDGSMTLVSMNEDPINLWATLRLSAYPKMTLYSGSGDSTDAVTAAPRVNAKSWGSHVNEFTLQQKFNGKVWTGKIIGSSSTQTSTFDFDAEPNPVPTTNSGNAIIKTSVDVYIKSLVAFEYITGISNASPTQGDTVTLAGNFRAAQQAGDRAYLKIGSTTEDITSHITTWNSANVVINLNTVASPYGLGVIQVVEDGGNSGTIALNYNAPSGSSITDVVDPSKGVTNVFSIFDATSGTTAVATGDQVQYDTLAGLDIKPNGTFTYSGTDTQIAIRYRIFSRALSAWTGYATTTTNIDFASLVNLSDFVVTTKPAEIDYSVDHANNTGNIYLIVSKAPVRPTLAQAKAGKDGYNATAVKALTLTPDASGTTTGTINDTGNGAFYIFMVQETSTNDLTNMVWDKFTILGVPVVPNITVQPVSGTVQESRRNSSHDFEVTASPIKNLQWQMKKNGGNWEDVLGETNTLFNVRGLAYLHSDSPIQVRAFLTGEGAATTYTDEVTLTVNEAPYIEETLHSNVPDGTYFARFWTNTDDNEGTDLFHSGTVTVASGKFKVYVDNESNRKYTGFIYHEKATNEWKGTGVRGSTK